MFRNLIKDKLKDALNEAGAGKIDPAVLSTTNPSFGDYYSPVLLNLKKAGNQQKIEEIAKKLQANLEKNADQFKTEVAKNFLINFTITPSLVKKSLKNILDQNEGFGANESGKGKKASIEFVSANPTGPLHFGNARGGPIGDSLAKVLEFSGWSVSREYIHNDVGGQVERLGISLQNISKGEKLDQQEYKGEYLKDLSSQVGSEDDPRVLGKKAVDKMLAEILSDSESLGISFDIVSSESEIAKSGKTKEVLDLLKSKGVLKEQEGALWFAPKDEFLKDREAVVVKSDGSYTYFADDIAYHYLKFKQEPDLVVDIFGADHHGHAPKLKAAISSLGFDVSKFNIILYQWVRFKRGGEVVKTSKRLGNIVTAREVLDEVGKDAVRYFIVSHDVNSPIDFDLEQAKKQSNENPVYYIQYAHARAASILRRAQEDGFSLKVLSEETLDLLNDDSELALAKHLELFPELVEDIAKNFSVHLLAHYIYRTADLFHRNYEKERVVGDDKAISQARLALVQASKVVLHNGLKLIGVSAPERMSGLVHGNR